MVEEMRRSGEEETGNAIVFTPIYKKSTLGSYIQSAAW